MWSNFLTAGIFRAQQYGPRLYDREENCYKDKIFQDPHVPIILSILTWITMLPSKIRCTIAEMIILSKVRNAFSTILARPVLTRRLFHKKLKHLLSIFNLIVKVEENDDCLRHWLYSRIIVWVNDSSTQLHKTQTYNCVETNVKGTNAYDYTQTTLNWATSDKLTSHHGAKMKEARISFKSVFSSVHFCGQHLTYIDTIRIWRFGYIIWQALGIPNKAEWTIRCIFSKKWLCYWYQKTLVVVTFEFSIFCLRVTI